MTATGNDRWLAWLRNDPPALKPGELHELYRQMGSLADWWLGSAARQRLRDECGLCLVEPSLPTAAGSGVILFAQETPPPWPLLPRAFLLPLVWREDTPNSPQLPSCLQHLAREVAEALQLPSWGLHLSADAGLVGVDLSLFDDVLSVASGWAALAGSLLVAAEGGRPSPAVWATGAWNPHSGIRPIGHLELKVDLACQWRVRQLFVPESQVDLARQLARARNADLQIGRLYEGQSDPREALRDYRWALDLPPLPTAPRDQRRDYFLRQQPEQRARDYYRTHLLPDIVRDLAQQWDEQGGTPASHLVTIVSDNPELAFLTLAMVRPQKALLLATSDKQAGCAEVRQLLSDGHLGKHVAGVQCEFAEFQNQEELLIQLAERVCRFVATASPEGVVLDLTPGTKEMSLRLALEVARPGNRKCYVRHRRQGSRVVPLSEKAIIFDYMATVHLRGRPWVAAAGVVRTRRGAYTRNADRRRSAIALCQAEREAPPAGT